MGGRGSSNRKFDPSQTPNLVKQRYDELEGVSLEQQRANLYQNNDKYNQVSNGEKYLNNLIRYTTNQGIKFEYDNSLPGNGRAIFLKDGTVKIQLKESLSTSGKIKTLAHEIAHTKLHQPDSPTNPGGRGMKEAEAEMVGYNVSKQLGINTDNYSIDYMAGWLRRDNIDKSYADTAYQKTSSLSRELLNAAEGQ
jgi:hypothetical protein